MARTMKLAAPATQIATAVAAAPSAPYTDDVVAAAGLAAWAVIQITLNAGTVSLTGPVKVIGECDGRMVEIGILNQGAAIAPTANLGYQEIVFGVGVCSKVGILPAGVTGGGSYNAFCAPVEDRPL